MPRLPCGGASCRSHALCFAPTCPAPPAHVWWLRGRRVHVQVGLTATFEMLAKAPRRAGGLPTRSGQVPVAHGRLELGRGQREMEAHGRSHDGWTETLSTRVSACADLLRSPAER